MKRNFLLLAKSFFVILLIVSLFAYAMFQGGFVSWFLFYGFLTLFLYQLVFLLYPIKKWKVTRILSEHIVQSGDTISVTIKINRKIPFPLYYCVLEEVIPESLNKVDDRSKKFLFMHEPEKINLKRHIKKVIFPWFKREFLLSYELDRIPRGEHVLKGIRIKTSDVFGFIKKEFSVLNIDELAVFPNKRPIIFNNHLTSYSKGLSSSQMLKLKQTDALSGIREYNPGDQYSWIHWKQTAQKNKIMTKEFEQEKNTETLLVIDRSDYRGLNSLAFEGMIEVAVALIDNLKKKASRIDIISIGADIVRFPNSNNSRIEESINQHLTSIKPSLDKPFALVLKQELIEYSADVIPMIVTTRLNVDLVKTYQQINQRYKSIMIFYIQATKETSLEQDKNLEQLRYLGISVYVLTGKELVKDPIEVML